jgi:hypothetical protein
MTTTIQKVNRVDPTAYLIAKLSLAGHTVIRGGENDFIVTRYGLTRYCKDSAALADFAKKVGATK